ncbi:MAG: GyrI-like domain-containing protein [Dehalococcoidia bacterium]|nr:GyrI-like domain-containing protein [Dehalococcoidia bacterium]
MTPGKPAPTEPCLIDLPSQKMAVVRGRGVPDKVFPDMMPALYGSVYTLKFALKKQGLPTFKVSPPRARYPDILASDKASWTIVLGIPVPEDTSVLPQKVPGVTVALETWSYGPTAEILHVGGYDQETPSIERLRAFIEASGYEIAGDHEEEYLTRPDAKVMKTIIRYPVSKKG